MRGDLSTLRSTGGGFRYAVDLCLENDSLDIWAADDDEPAPGEGFFYLARLKTGCRSGTYNCGVASQIGDRDLEIEASALGCP